MDPAVKLTGISVTSISLEFLAGIILRWVSGGWERYAPENQGDFDPAGVVLINSLYVRY